MPDYTTITNITNQLKYVYGDNLRNLFNDEVTTYNLFPKSSITPGGKGYVFGLRIARNQSTGGVADGGHLPIPLTGKKITGLVTPAYIYGTLKMTGPAISAGRGNAAAFVDTMADEIEDIYQSIKVDLNRQSHWDGFGQLGRISSASSASSSATWACTFDNDIGVRYFIEGQLVDFYASAGGTVPGATGSAAFAQRVLTINPATKVVTFETNSTNYATSHPTLSAYTNGVTCTLPEGALAVKLGARTTSHASTNTPLEMTGLAGAFDDATLLAVYEGITVATNPKWAVNVLSNSSVNRELSIDLMLQGCDVARMASGAKINRMLMGLGQKRKYANTMLGDVRFQPTILKGGYETLSFAAGDGTVQMIIDPMCQPNRIYMDSGENENGAAIEKFELEPLGWGNLDGSQLHAVTGYDAYEAYLRIYTFLGTESRNDKVLLKDLVEPSLYG